MIFLRAVIFVKCQTLFQVLHTLVLFFVAVKYLNILNGSFWNMIIPSYWWPMTDKPVPEGGGGVDRRKSTKQGVQASES